MTKNKDYIFVLSFMSLQTNSGWVDVVSIIDICMPALSHNHLHSTKQKQNKVFVAEEWLDLEACMLLLVEQIAKEMTWSPWLRACFFFSMVVCLGKDFRLQCA